MLTMVSNFGEWLNSILKERGWKQADLVHRGIDSGYLSKVTSGLREPGLSFVVDIADALGLRRIEVFRAAGYIETEEELDEMSSRLGYKYALLSSEEKAAVDAVIESFYTRRRSVEEDTGKPGERIRKSRRTAE